MRHPKVVNRMVGSATPGRYRVLLVSLIALLAILGLMPQRDDHPLLRLAFLGLMLASLWTIRKNHALFVVALVLALLTLVSPFLAFLPVIVSGVVEHAAAVLLVGVMIASITRHILREREVTEATVSGASCVYLLLGVLWARVFTLIEIAVPGSFTYTSPLVEMEAHAMAPAVKVHYFSFVTLTTLGYGDYAPLSATARMFSAIEAVTGQLVVAILIARMVGLYVASASRPAPLHTTETTSPNEG